MPCGPRESLLAGRDGTTPEGSRECSESLLIGREGTMLDGVLPEREATWLPGGAATIQPPSVAEIDWISPPV